MAVASDPRAERPKGLRFWTAHAVVYAIIGTGTAALIAWTSVTLFPLLTLILIAMVAPPLLDRGYRRLRRA